MYINDITKKKNYRILLYYYYKHRKQTAVGQSLPQCGFKYKTTIPIQGYLFMGTLLSRENLFGTRYYRSFDIHAQ